MGGELLRMKKSIQVNCYIIACMGGELLRLLHEAGQLS